MAPAPVKRRTSPIVWILVGILGLFLLCVIGVMAAGFFIARNPGMVMSKLITAANPDVEVLNTDLGAKTLRIRDRKTGKEVTVSFDDAKSKLGSKHKLTPGKNGQFVVEGVGRSAVTEGRGRADDDDDTSALNEAAADFLPLRLRMLFGADSIRPTGDDTGPTSSV